MALKILITSSLRGLANSIIHLTSQQYKEPLSVLSDSSIGQHTRHIIELFQCLQNGYDQSTICYDHRERNKQIESDIGYATATIESIISSLDKPNTNLKLVSCLQDGEVHFETNYHRELFYNYEHCIHHQALIKIGMNALGISINDKNFGLAVSTQNFRLANS